MMSISPDKPPHLDPFFFCNISCSRGVCNNLVCLLFSGLIPFVSGHFFLLHSIISFYQSENDCYAFNLPRYSGKGSLLRVLHDLVAQKGATMIFP